MGAGVRGTDGRDAEGLGGTSRASRASHRFGSIRRHHEHSGVSWVPARVQHRQQRRAHGGGHVEQHSSDWLALG